MRSFSKLRDLRHEGRHSLIALGQVIMVVSLSTGTVPAATLYVGTRSLESDKIGIGTREHPYRELADAVRQMAPGDQLVLLAGVYREALDFRSSRLSGARETQQPTVVRAEAGQTVTIKGSDVVIGWESIGSGLFVKRPWTVNSQQVFVDGVPLRQIGGTNFASRQQWPGRVPGGAKDLVEGSFFWDERASALYIKAPAQSMDGRTVEVSVRPYLLIATKLEGLTVEGIAFAHSNTTAIARHGCVTLNGRRLHVRRLSVSHCDGIGILLHGDDNELEDSTAMYCGQLGMHIRGSHVRISGNETSYNNTRGFDKWWEAGGVKFIGDGGLRDSLVLGHKAFRNNGDGIWFDWGNQNIVVDGAVSAYNTGFGIHYEASRAASIVNSFTFANGLRGIYLPHSSDSLVANNLVIGNGMDGIVVVDEGRRDPSGVLDLQPKGNVIVGNILGWNRRTDLILPADMLTNRSDYNLYLANSELGASFSAGWASAIRPNKRGLAAWQRAVGQDLHSNLKVMQIPAQLADALREQRKEIDWGPLLREGGEFVFNDETDPLVARFRDQIHLRYGPSSAAP